MEIGEILGPGGLVSKRLPVYEERPQQLLNQLQEKN